MSLHYTHSTRNTEQPKFLCELTGVRGVTWCTLFSFAGLGILFSVAGLGEGKTLAVTGWFFFSDGASLDSSAGRLIPAIPPTAHPHSEMFLVMLKNESN